jgi:hypothetical protein
VFEVAKDIWNHEGKLTLFAGWTSGFFKSISGGILLVVYDRLQMMVKIANIAE